MATSLEVKIKTLTPLWTGGVDGTCDRLHVSGLIGSMRYWYEAIVRGVGGYACDPSQGGGCTYLPYDAKYPEKTGAKSICAACYLFGATGWSRLFRLSATAKATEPLHFRTFPREERGKMGDPNSWWLNRIFEKDQVPLSEEKTVYITDDQELTLRFLGKSTEWKYVQSQLKMLLWFMANYAGLGAKQQFGFGLFDCEMTYIHWTQGLEDLKNFMRHHELIRNQIESIPIYDEKTVLAASLSDFFAVRGLVDENVVMREISLPQLSFPIPNRKYLASAFDIRYKGDQFVTGFRQSMKGKAGIGKISENALFGAGAKNMNESESTASRIFVSMPLEVEQGQYLLRISGFAIPNLRWNKKSLTAHEIAWFTYLYLTTLQAKNIEISLPSTQFKWGKTR